MKEKNKLKKLNFIQEIKYPVWYNNNYNGEYWKLLKHFDGYLF